MRIAWTYELPLSDDRPDSSRAPLHWHDGSVWLPIGEYVRTREEASSLRPRGGVLRVHRVAPSGAAETVTFESDRGLISQKWSFLQLGTQLVIHVGPFHALPNGKRLDALARCDASSGPGPGQFIVHESHLIFANPHGGDLHCHRVDSQERSWRLHLPNSARVPVGPLAVRGGQLVCFGRDVLNHVNITTGQVESTRAFPRLGRVFPPSDFEGDLLFPFSGVSSGGLMRIKPDKERPCWKYTKRGGYSPPTGTPLPIGERTAVLSINGGSSLVGVDLDGGQELWTFRAQWLYTPIEMMGEDIVFGTAGGYGRHLRCHHMRTGETKWAIQMEGGCPYFTRVGDHFLAGDWAGVLRRIRGSDGQVMDELRVGGPITSAPLVQGDRAYVLRWPPTGLPALLAVDLC